MSQPVDIAIVGASGLLGEALVEQLGERELPVRELFLLGSDEALGHSLAFRGHNIRVRELERFDFEQVTLVFFLQGPQALFQRLRDSDCLLIDLSGQQRLPALVPGWNPSAVPARQVASPASAVVALLGGLAPIRHLIELQRIVVSVCLPASAHGNAGVRELARQTAELLNGRPLEPRLFARQVAFNIFASDDRAIERRILSELTVLFGQPDLPVSVTCIQVPVFFGESLSLSLVGARPLDMGAIEASLDAAGHIDLASAANSPGVVDDAVGQERICMGRPRAVEHDPCSLDLWLVADDLKKGTVSNALDSAELLIKHYL
ncbi:aspartate-semialdehyde dehydrogenase [Stutzerimonas kirkiae]|uniref:Aspartate-semialdehyde dehydrogenase n=1 Tax=Stutzerimonas kirkiae TaxID=2211392 RepID=A0A4Q9R9A8_9GAMM|nr:aspartate-semialdehyde dehydrogenase [Stutzerimonas kirkiae]TBU97263.1 aspartate-semialdehyde dehydrogenase [Stutzerimonas kirkiae]TBV03686.1 aspartate-semialdehyde dehydrogenase [Stutzerimonas kirkiae]